MQRAPARADGGNGNDQSDRGDTHRVEEGCPVLSAGHHKQPPVRSAGKYSKAMMLLAASLPTFQRLFPNFQAQCTTLYTMLLPVACVLIVAGLIAAVKHCQTPRSMVRPIVTSMMIVMAVAEWGNWTDTAKDALQTVVSQMNANPQQAAQQYVNVLVSKEQPQQKSGWFGLPSAAQMYEAILWGFLSLIGLIASFLIWVAYIIQQFLVGLAYAFAPLFIGFLAVRSTSSIGLRYIMGTVGIIAWPLGWAAASIGTSNLIDVATEQGLVTNTDLYSLQTILAGAVIGGWIILTTLIAPVIIQAAVSSGAQIGSALLGGALTAGAAAISAGSTTAATLASGGASTAGMLMGGAAATAASLAGSTMYGSGGPLSGSLVQSLAYNLPRNSSANSNRTDDPQGGAKGSQPPPYNPKDAANDGEAARMIDQSKEGVS